MGDTEDKAFWTSFLRSLRARGLGGVATIYKVYGHLLSDDAPVERDALSALRAAAVAALEEPATVVPSA